MTRFILLLSGLVFLLSAAPSFADQRGVRVDGKSAAEYLAEQTGKSWAVVIGINEYKNDIPKLRYAVADAEAVGRELEARGFSVTRLLDREATRDRILEVLGDDLPAQMKPDDRLLIFYAGHGETKTIAGGQTMGYLLPVEAQREKLHKTAISMGEIKQLAGLLPAKHVLFVVDVCYGGIAGQQTRSLPAQTEAYLKQITQEKGRQLITAGGPGQQVVEGPQWGHSVFTYYLLEGLTKGLADLNHDGVIPTSELYAYLDGRVPAASENQQRPEKWDLAPEKGEFVFFTSAKGAELSRSESAAPSPNPARLEQPSRQQPLIAPEDMSESDRLALMKRQVAEERRKLREARLHAHEEAGQTGQSSKRIDTASPREVLAVSNEKPVRVKSATLLEKGRWYLIEASGVVSNWDGGNDGMDAIWCYAESRCGKQGEVRNQLKVNGKGLSEIAGRVLPYDPGHVYRVLVLGEGQKLEFYSDNVLEDGMHNSGAYTVRIYSEP